MSTRSEQIIAKVIEILKGDQNGMRYSELVRRIHIEFPEIPLNTIHGTIWNAEVRAPKEIYKPARGLFRHIRFREEEEAPEKPTLRMPVILKTTEEDFYEPFAGWLKNELGECTEAVPLGGNTLGKKWGTPDVIGVYKSSKKDVIQFPSEIIAAEIKLDPKEPITAFGQAVAYRLFSSKVYLVEPSAMLDEDLDRIEALCMLSGIGLIIFDPDPKNPNFRIRVRAQKHTPDMFYANELADQLYNKNKKMFDRLF